MPIRTIIDLMTVTMSAKRCNLSIINQSSLMPMMMIIIIIVMIHHDHNHNQPLPLFPLHWLNPRLTPFPGRTWSVDERARHPMAAVDRPQGVLVQPGRDGGPRGAPRLRHLLRSQLLRRHPPDTHQQRPGDCRHVAMFCLRRVAMLITMITMIIIIIIIIIIVNCTSNV